MFTMWINLFVTAVTVTAIKVDPNNIRDHALAQSKTDFSSFRDEHFDGTDSHSHGGRSFEGPEFDHREFSEFNNRQFRQMDMSESPTFGLLELNFGHYYGGSDRRVGSVFNNQEFYRRSGVNHDQYDMENSFKQIALSERSNSGSKARDHDTSDTFDSVTRIPDRTMESHFKRGGSSKLNINIYDYNDGFQNKDIQERYSSQNFLSGDKNPSIHEKINDRYGEDSETQRTIQQIQQFVYQLNRRNKYSERLVQDHSQRLLNKRNEFEQLPTIKNKRKVNINHKGNTKSSEEVKQNITGNPQDYEPKFNSTEKDSSLPVNDQNKETTTLIPSISTDMSYNGAADDQRPRFKSTTDNEVVPVVRTGTEDRVSPEEEDRWIWSNGEGTENPPIITRIGTTSDGIDDRIAFDGGKCPTGTKRFGDTCVAID